MQGCRDNQQSPSAQRCCCAVLVLALFAVMPSTMLHADDLLAHLHSEVEREPDNGTSWRLLGRHLINLDQTSEAHAALTKAVELIPDSAAAWHDFGRACLALGYEDDAVEAFRIAIALAPESTYSESARSLLEELGHGESDIQLASWEIRRFDGEEYLDRLEDTDPPRRRWLPDSVTFRLETGLLFNSNVALAPVSRQLAPGERASFQFYAAPDVRWSVFDEPEWRAGPTYKGRYTFNEANFRRFDLQSFRPGWFTEWFIYHDDRLIVPSIAYDYTHDMFDGATLGSRHGLLASVATFWNDEHASFLFWATDYTDFRNDGIVPDVTSQDGWLNTIGLSHDVTLPYRHLHLVRGGVDVSQADTDGSDYRYRGVNLFVDGVFPIVESLELKLSGGWGYRDFPDYEFDPSRNESLWRGGAELRHYFSDNVSVAAICDYNSFDSRSPLFTADRLILGTVAEIEY